MLAVLVFYPAWHCSEGSRSQRSIHVGDGFSEQHRPSAIEASTCEECIEAPPTSDQSDGEVLKVTSLFAAGVLIKGTVSFLSLNQIVWIAAA